MSTISFALLVATSCIVSFALKVFLADGWNISGVNYQCLCLWESMARFFASATFQHVSKCWRFDQHHQHQHCHRRLIFKTSNVFAFILSVAASETWNVEVMIVFWGAVECWYGSPLNFYVVRFTWNFCTSWDVLRRLYRRWPATVDDGLQLVELSDQDWPETRLGQLLFSGQCLLPDRSFFVSTGWWLFDDIKGFDFSNWHHFWVVPNKQPWDSAGSDKPLWIFLKHPDKCVIVIAALNWKGVCSCVPTIWNLEIMSCHYWCVNVESNVCFFCVLCYCLEPVMFDFGISLQIS